MKLKLEKNLVLIAIYMIACLFSTPACAQDNSNIIRLSSQQIDDLKVNSMVDLLNQIPGIRASNTTISFNGFGTKEILVLLDGRAINDSTSAWRAVYWSSILVDNIALLEIIKGSTGGRYGGFSNGGIVKIITKQTDSSLQGNTHVSIGSANYKYISLTARKKMGNYGLNFSTKWNETDNFRDHQDKHNHKVSLRLKTYHPNIIPISLAFDYSKTDLQSPGPVYRLTPQAFSEKENIGASLILPFKAIKSETHFNLFNSDYNNNATGFIKQLKESQLKQQFFSSLSLGRAGQFNIGIDGVLQGISGLNLSARKETSLSLYLGKELTFANFLNSATSLMVQLDLKGNAYSEFPNIVNEGIRFSLPLDNLNITFSVASFNALPSASKRYYSSTTLRGNPSLKMEEGINYNFSLTTKLTELLDLSSALFYNETSNLIKYTREGVIGTYENIGSATTKGIQTDIKYQINEKIQSSISYTYLNALNDETHNFITYSPEHEINVNFEYKPLKGLLLASNTSYKSTRYYNSNNTGEIQGKYFRTNLRMDYSFSNKGSVYLKINNLFNAKFHGAVGYPVDPLSLYVGIKHHY